jgi:serine/threonine-protein kinase HipA
MVDYAYVNIWGTQAGVVTWDADRQLASFQYETKFLAKKWDLSPILMPISNGSIVYSFPELLPGKDDQHDAFNGLPGLLADALPDKYGNRLIERWLAQHGRPPNSMNPVEKLCFIGSRGMGALEFEPAQQKANKNSFYVEIDSLVDVAKKMLAEREGFDVQLSGDELQAMNEIFKIGTSAGGARPKAVIAYNPKTKGVRSGQARAPKGFEHWLIKLDGVDGAQFGESSGWGRVEYAYYLMAGDCGIDMMDCQLLEENNRAHFMTRRYDREGPDIKHHVQSLCGLQHFDFNDMYSYSYEQVFQTMRMLRLTYPEAEEMFRRMVFNVVATNYDDHTKNFAFRMKQGERWELAPAYDVCYANDPTNQWVNRQTLSINGKNENITSDDLMTIAKANSVKNGGHIIERIVEVVNNWNKYAQEVEVRKDLREWIGGNLAKARL